MRLLLVLVVPLVAANYRKFGFHNHDLCSRDEKGKSLQLGAGAALLTLDNPSPSMQNSKCSVKIVADQGFGLMVYIEDMHLRTRSEAGRAGKNRCFDYVQFGRDDLVPFFTLFKSEELCGNQTGFHYDEPGGKLLVWLNLGHSRFNTQDNIRLTVVVTAYKHGRTEDSTNFRLCSKGDRLIRKEYFCDWRINCALDAKPGDERIEICRHSRGSSSPGSPYDDQPGDWRPPLNLVSITLVLVSGVVLLVLVLLLIARMRRSGWWCRGGAGDECELPERAAAVAAAAAGDNARPSNSERSDIYLPLRMYLEPRQDSGLPTNRAGRGTTPDAEPPPAYHDLFPAGFKFDQEKLEGSSLDPMLHASKPEEDEVPEYVHLANLNQSSSEQNEMSPAAAAGGLDGTTAAVVDNTRSTDVHQMNTTATDIDHTQASSSTADQVEMLSSVDHTDTTLSPLDQPESVSTAANQNDVIP